MSRATLPAAMLDATDRAILTALQEGFPLCPRPFAEAAHNYERAHRLNMWFVLATETPAEIAATADRIEAATGLPVLRFPKEREFFIGFRVPL